LNFEAKTGFANFEAIRPWKGHMVIVFLSFRKKPLISQMPITVSNQLTALKKIFTEIKIQ